MQWISVVLRKGLGYVSIAQFCAKNTRRNQVTWSNFTYFKVKRDRKKTERMNVCSHTILVFHSFSFLQTSTFFHSFNVNWVRVNFIRLSIYLLTSCRLYYMYFNFLDALNHAINNTGSKNDGHYLYFPEMYCIYILNLLNSTEILANLL